MKEGLLYKQNHQYSYVMKRALHTPVPKSKHTPKNKPKTHSKSKDKKFNPLEYLNSLIDEIHDHRYDTVRKRPPSSHRLERSSALAYTTPITDRTASSSKVRSKSSYSQYRKRSLPLRDILRVDVEQAITEQDNYIHFTEETIHSSQPHLPPPSPSHAHPPLSPAVAARRIQRAWRRFQTLKVVKKYYMHYKNVVKKQREERDQEARQTKERKVDRRRQFQRTLKIKKSSEDNHNRTLRLTMGDGGVRMELSQENSINTTKQLVRQPISHEMNEAKTVELPLLQEGEVFSSQEYTSKDLKFVIDLFRSRQETASKEIDHQLNTFCQLQAQMTPLECFTSNQSELSPERTSEQVSADGLSPLVFLEMEKVIKEKYQLLKERLGQQRGEYSGEAEYRHRQEQIQGRMRRELRNIERCRQDYMRSIRQLKQNMLKLQADSSKIEKFYQQTGRTSVRVRKSYSADTLILKSILQDVTFKNFDVDSKARPHPPMVLDEKLKQEQRREEGMHLICPTSPPSGIIVPNNQNGWSKGSLGCYEFSDSDRLQEEMYNDSNVSYQHSSPPSSQKNVGGFQQEGPLSHCDSSSSIQISVKESNHSQAKEDPATTMLRECSQQIQCSIEKILLDQIVSQAFLNPKMYALFKPYIEHPFEFKHITDFDIVSFLDTELPRFFQAPHQILARFNQKINPNSLEILRLIRDFDFQIDEYELVLPEEVFKAYRRDIEQTYATKIKDELSAAAPDMQGIPEHLTSIIQARQTEKRQKRAKFLRFERDLKIMYMKSVFNCYNELIIETKSFYTFMNGRSSIGPGELTLALRQYNMQSDIQQCMQVLGQARSKVQKIIHEKSMLPIFRNYKQLQQFQRQVTRQISSEMTENEFKWVNYMDEVLEIWQELSSEICHQLLMEAAGEVAALRGDSYLYSC